MHRSEQSSITPESGIRFLLDGEDWSTDGRVLFNLNPLQAIEHFRKELEVVE